MRLSVARHLKAAFSIAALLLTVTLIRPQLALAAGAGLDKVDGKTVYRQADGELLKDGSIVIGKTKYVFGKDGFLTKKYRFYQPKWIRQEGKYYYRKDNGKILAKTGDVKIEGVHYYLAKDHSRCSGFYASKGKIFYFEKNGKRFEGTGFQTIKGKTYFFHKNHSLTIGMKRIGKYDYFFNSKGVLVVDQKLYVVNNVVYRIDKKGRMKKVNLDGNEDSSTGGSSETDLGFTDENGADEPQTGNQNTESGGSSSATSAAARQFIQAHSSSSQSAYERYRSCFNYLLAFQRFVVRSPGYYDLSQSGWADRFALDCFNSGLVGDCYGFACCMAAIGRELGYSPTVYVASQDHCFVVVNGRYIDNMGAQFFSTTEHSSYNIIATASF